MDKKTIKILHTSDWHLGNSLYNAKRDQEFSVFLNWMLKTIEDNHIDVLLIAGDVFDNANPSNAVRSQYYDFLRRLMSTSCQHVVITAGNHCIFFFHPALHDRAALQTGVDITGNRVPRF